MIGSYSILASCWDPSLLGRSRAFRSSGVNVWTRVSQLTHVVFVIATMRRMPTCLNQSGWRPCPNRLLSDVFFGTRTRTSVSFRAQAFRHPLSAICHLSVSWNSRCYCSRPLGAIQVLCCSISNTLFLVVPGKNTSTKLLTSMMNCSFFHGAKLPTYRRQPFVPFLSELLPSLIELLQVADYGLQS